MSKESPAGKEREVLRWEDFLEHVYTAHEEVEVFEDAEEDGEMGSALKEAGVLGPGQRSP